MPGAAADRISGKKYFFGQPGERMGEGEIAARIRRKLNGRLAPTVLDVRDESHLHAGHAGARAEGETHFRLTVVSAAFAGKTRIERHRLVHDLLAEELEERVHALTLTARTPEEAGGT
jgi:BolA protein